MDTKTDHVTVDPDVALATLTAEVAAEQNLLAGLDLAIGRLYETRQTAVARLWDKQSKLRTLEHYTALARQAGAR